MTDVFALKDFSFSEGFLGGSATAGHQIEGNNVHSGNWYAEWEWLKKDPKAEVSGMACNHYNSEERKNKKTEILRKPFRQTKKRVYKMHKQIFFLLVRKIS